MKKGCLYTSLVLNFAFKITDIIVYSERRSSFSHHVVVSGQESYCRIEEDSLKENEQDFLFPQLILQVMFNSPNPHM